MPNNLFYDSYQSPLGYRSLDNGYDTYGVDHSQFTTREEVEYQYNRVQREKELMQQQRNMGITGNYIQYGTNFWNKSPENNYGFGGSETSKNPYTNSLQEKQEPIPPLNQYTTDNSDLPTNNSYSHSQPNTFFNFDNNRYRKMENSALMAGLDTLYGMNRAINGMTFGGLDWAGNKLGYDTQMTDYLNLKKQQGKGLSTQIGGYIAELGGGMLTGKSAYNLAKPCYNQADLLYTEYKIGKAYDRLSNNPLQGNGSDIVTRMKNHNGERVILQRGEAMLNSDGQIVTHGKQLKHLTGTKRNYGLDKIIYKHNVPKEDVVKLPRYIKNNTPIETTPRNQDIYSIQSPKGEIRIVTTPRNKQKTISSMYIVEE